MTRVGIVMFEQVDLLDVTGPYEVLLTASRLAVRDGDAPPFEVLTLGGTPDPIGAFGGLRALPHVALEQAGRLDVVIVPGAIAIEAVLADKGLLAAIGRAADDAPIVASVCTGAFVLGELGLLDGRRWTTHWEDIDRLAERLGAPGEHGVLWVDSGEVVTSGGVSCGIAMALHLVDRLSGRALAERSARQLHYRWTPDPTGA